MSASPEAQPSLEGLQQHEAKSSGTSGGGEPTNAGGKKENGTSAGTANGTGNNVASLGDALAGVSLGGNSHSPTTEAFTNFAIPNGGGTGGSGGSGGPTTSGSGESVGGGGNAGANQDASGWGNFTDVSTSGGAESAFGAATTTSSSNDPAAPSPVDPSAETIQLFLSRDPSQTLGEDVFKLSHTNLTSLATGGGGAGNNEENPTNASSAFRLNGHGHSGLAAAGIGTSGSKSSNSTGNYAGTTTTTESLSRTGTGNNRMEGGGGRTESPASAVTAGTSSTTRSTSPYNANSHGNVVSNNNAPGAAGTAGGVPGTEAMGGAHTIQAFHAYDAPQVVVPPVEPDYANGFPPPGSPAYDVGSPYKQPKPPGYDGYAATAAPPPPPQPQLDPAPGQVLYMAVPSPDGRGQVLQPVQMVQLPGSKQMAYVVAGPAGAMPPPEMAAAAAADPYAGGGASLGAIGSPNSSNSAANRGMGAYGAPPPEQPRSVYQEQPNRSEAPTSSSEYSRNGGGGGNQFHADPAIASLYASPQRPPLDALLGQVRRLSRDQVGCRLVQQALDEEGPMAASLILQEGLPFWGEAMVDPFGNYLFQKILEKVSSQERIMLVKSVSTRLVNASLNLHGTRSVQKVVELCAQDEHDGSAAGENGESSADILTESLRPAAARLCIDSHGNHVIQRIILKLGPKHAEFVFEAVANSVGDVARHRHGCCVIQRCLDSPPSEARSLLVHRIVEKALELMQDAYGNYVVQYVLDVCSDEDVHAVCESVVGKVNLLAIQKFSSNVMEKCLERCSERVKSSYMKEMSDPDRIRELMMDPFGNYVVQRALSVATHAQAIQLVEAMRPHLVATSTSMGVRNGGVRNTAGGRRIIAKICRRFPNFSLTPGEQDLYRRNAAPGLPHGGAGGPPPPQHHDELLYSRNKGRYQGGGGGGMPPSPQVLSPGTTYAAVGGPPLPQAQPQQQSFLRAPDRGPYGASQVAPAQSHYNPLGVGGAPLAAPYPYDPFGTSGVGGGGTYYGM